MSRLTTTWTELAATGRLLREFPKFIPSGKWNIARLVREKAEQLPNHIALRYLDESTSWREFNEHVNRYAHYFATLGLIEGDAVALLMDNRPDFIFAQIGLSRLGAVTALINTNLTGKGLVHAINIGNPTLVVVGSEHAREVREVVAELDMKEARVMVQAESPGADTHGFESTNEAVARSPKSDAGAGRHVRTSDPMAYIYTSGTTGLPKAAIVTNQRFMLASSMFANVMHELEPEDAVYVTLPLYHSNAQWGGLAACVLSGATLILRRKFSASHFWSDARKYEATRFIYIGELCRYLLNTPVCPDERNHRLRMGVGNGLRPDIWEEFQRRFGVPMMREFYGATEGNAPMLNVEGRPGMVGRLRPGQFIVKCDAASGDVVRNQSGFCTPIAEGETGLLLGKINRVSKFDGYVDKKATGKKVIEDVFKKGDQFFNSGDLLTLYDNKWVAFADRVGDTFRWKGENVSTNEVGETLNRAEGVLESNVYGVQVPGKDGRAGMASLNVDSSFDLDAFAKFVETSLPNYQRPWFIRVQDNMRITGTFKHQKVDYRKEGYDPAAVGADKVYFFQDSSYVPIDHQLFESLQSGQVGPR